MAYRYSVAQTEEEKQECFKLRYQIYVEEFGFEDPSEHPNKMETDKYDKHSVHILAHDNATNKVAGTVRIVLPSSLGFPAQQFPTGLQYSADCPRPNDLALAEISRMAVAKEFRRASQQRAAFGENMSPPPSPPPSPSSQRPTAPLPPVRNIDRTTPPTSPRRRPGSPVPPVPLARSNSMEQRLNDIQQQSPPSSPRGGEGPELMLGLLSKAILTAQSLHADYFLFVTEPKIVRCCAHYGLGAAFVKIGELTEYHGVGRAPYLANVNEMLEKAEELNPAVHSYLMREKKTEQQDRPVNSAMAAPTPSLRRHLLTRQKSVSQMAAFFDAPIGSY